MNISLRFWMILAVNILIGHTAISQSPAKQEPLTVVRFAENVKEHLTSKELLQIKEVYGLKTDEVILNHTQRVKDIKNILRNRVVIVDAGNKDLSPLKKLSQVELLDGLQGSVTRDVTFDPTDFNPLKYKFNFYSRNSDMYWVDNTKYFIVIKSQYQ